LSLRLARGPSFDTVVAAFVRRVTRLPQTCKVLIEHDGQATRIWTIIDAEPFDRSARAPVYAAELATLDEAGGLDVAFRLVNQREYGQGDLSAIVPAEAKVVWSREPVADRA